MNINRLMAVFTILPLFSLPAAGAELSQMQSLASFVEGSYRLIGKGVDSERTYYGRVTLIADEAGLGVERHISGKSVIGRAAIESVGEDGVHVLRIRFEENSTGYEETCMVSGDLDNYARITCYLYRPGIATVDPGLEAMFIERGDH